ncbi:MAG: arsenic efflux protein [Bacteroidales bacterium]|nr:arsenic efflux protein [Bacteroidales bacterium]
MLPLTVIPLLASTAESWLGGLWSVVWHAFTSSLEITGWVILMMSLIELVNVSSSGRLLERFQHRPVMQVLVAALLGAIPGCAGGFAVVSMFTHRMVTFGALIAGMIATFGDEAFYLFATSPKWGLILTAILFVLAVLVGLVLTFFGEKWNFTLEPHAFEIHQDVDEHAHSHEDEPHEQAVSERKEKVSHFLKEHIWNHVIRQHLLKVFLWSFGVLLVLQGLEQWVDLDVLLTQNHWAQYIVLLVALLVGFIPQSGPNLVFIIMFLNGNVPFAILLANSIAQNGHAGLPLLAQSRKNFFIMKGFTVGLGLLCGLLLLGL